MLASVTPSSLHGQGAQLLDRVVARVNGMAITQTDVDAALALGIIEVQPGEERVASATRQLIDRRLILAEVARFPPADPPAASIDELHARMKAHAGAEYENVLKRTGLDDNRARELARDTLRIEAYIEQRFGTTTQVSPQDVRAYYDSHPEDFTRNGVLAPFEQVEAEARQGASAERRRRTIDQWLTDLRARGDVVETTPPARPAAPPAN